MADAVIVDAVRTASGKGKPGGALSGVHPVDLLATALQGLSHIVENGMLNGEVIRLDGAIRMAPR